METPYFLGIDVSKDRLDAALTLDGKNYFETHVENSIKAITLWFNSLQKQFCFAPDQLIVCLEHSGVYCNPVIEFAHKKGVKVCMESSGLKG
jgi:transposase